MFSHCCNTDTSRIKMQSFRKYLTIQNLHTDTNKKSKNEQIHIGWRKERKREQDRMGERKGWGWNPCGMRGQAQGVWKSDKRRRERQRKGRCDSRKVGVIEDISLRLEKQKGGSWIFRVRKHVLELGGIKLEKKKERKSKRERYVWMSEEKESAQNRIKCI